MDKADKELQRAENRKIIWTFIFIIKILIDALFYIALIFRAIRGRYYYPYPYMGEDWVPYPLTSILRSYIEPVIFLIVTIIMMLLGKKNKKQFISSFVLLILELIILIITIILFAISKPGPV